MIDSTRSIQEFLDATAARTPTPGGGSVSALVGALAASLGEMVLNYSINKKGLEAFTGEFAPALAELTRARAILVELMAEDQEAYDAVRTARKLPDDAPEKAQQLAEAMLLSTRVPEAIAAASVKILERCDQLVGFVNINLISDLAVCADLAMAAIRCAIYSVRTNLGTLSDSAERQRTEATVDQLLQRAVALIQNVTPRIWGRHEMGV